VTWSYDNGRLTLRGSLPSFYLKQVLQELLRSLRDVRQIINDVGVVSVNGRGRIRLKVPTDRISGLPAG
jgi:hypothetical protein